MFDWEGPVLDPSDWGTLEDTWRFNFLCCYDTRDGRPRHHQAWRPSNDINHNDHLSLIELFRDPIPEWGYLLQRWEKAPMSQKLPWMRHRILHHATTILDRYKDRAEQLTSLDKEMEYNELKEYYGSESSPLMTLMTAGLAAREIEPWRLLHPGLEDKENSERLAVAFIRHSMHPDKAPSRPVLRRMMTGEGFFYILPLSTLPLSRDWLSEDRYLQQATFPEVPLHQLIPLSRARDLQVPAHAFCQSKTFPWGRPVMTTFDYMMRGPIVRLLNTFGDTDIHAQQHQQYSGVFVPSPLPYPNSPVYVTKSQFIKPQVIGYSHGRDPYNLQKFLKMNDVSNPRYQPYSSWLTWMALHAPNNYLLSGQDGEGILALYAGWMKRYEMDHEKFYNKPPKPMCIVWYFDMSGAGCACGRPQPRRLAEYSARLINNLVVFTRSEGDPVLAMPPDGNGRQRHQRCYRFRQDQALKADLWISFEDAGLGLPIAMRAYLRFVHSAGYQLFDMHGGTEEMKGRRGAWQGAGSFSYEPCPEYLDRHQFMKSYESHLELESCYDFYGPNSPTQQSHCFCRSAGCWTRGLLNPESSPLLANLYMWDSLHLDWSKYIDTRMPWAVPRLLLQTEGLLDEHNELLKRPISLKDAFKLRGQADGLWKEIINIGCHGRYYQRNLLRKLDPLAKVGCEDRMLLPSDIQQNLFWMFLRAWKAEMGPPAPPPVGRRKLRVEKWEKKFVITSHPEYGHAYSAVKITPAQWDGEHSDKPVVTYEEAREILRERGEEIMESGYMDRRLHISPDTSDGDDEEGSISDSGSDHDVSSHHDGETLTGM